jgi:hypothetical protein
MRGEIVLPPHLYDRIKASAGEHGGIGAGELFNGRCTRDTESGVPVCAHGHAWGTAARYNDAPLDVRLNSQEPELAKYLTANENDNAIEYGEGRISFAEWCCRLNVKRGPETVALRVEAAQEIEALV